MQIKADSSSSYYSAYHTDRYFIFLIKLTFNVKTIINIYLKLIFLSKNLTDGCHLRMKSIGLKITIKKLPLRPYISNN